MSEKIFRKDLLIENLRKTLFDSDESCLWCPIKSKCNTTHMEFLCDDDRADDFKQAIIDRFSTEVEVE